MPCPGRLGRCQVQSRRASWHISLPPRPDSRAGQSAGGIHQASRRVHRFVGRHPCRGRAGPGLRQALRHPRGSPLAFMGVEELRGRPTSSCRVPLGPLAAQRPRTASPRPAHRRPARGEIPACRRCTYRHGAGPSAPGPRTCGWAGPIGAAGPPRLRGGRRGRPPGLAPSAPALMRNGRRPQCARHLAPRTRPRQSASHVCGTAG